jgi:hypothetical protein
MSCTIAACPRWNWSSIHKGGNADGSPDASLSYDVYEKCEQEQGIL